MNVNMNRLFQRVFEQAGDDGAGGGEGGEGGEREGGSEDRAAVEQRASDMGWSPKDKWRGPADQWIDAPDFIRRGEEVMPVLRANLRKEQAARQALETRLQQADSRLAAAQESIQVLTNLTTKESREKAKERRRELLRQQAQARKDENQELEVQLGEEIADVTAEIKAGEVEGGDADTTPAGRKKPNGQSQGPTGSDPATDPAFVAWKGDNPWFGTDNRRTALAVEIGRELRQAGDRTTGREFFDKVTAEVDKVFSPPARAKTGKVESGGGGGGAGGGGGGSEGSNAAGKVYKDLPAEAKAACERQASWVVGEGRAFKDIAAWRKHYTDMYFNS